MKNVIEKKHIIAQRICLRNKMLLCKPGQQMWQSNAQTTNQVYDTLLTPRALFVM